MADTQRSAWRIARARNQPLNGAGIPSGDGYFVPKRTVVVVMAILAVVVLGAGTIVSVTWPRSPGTTSPDAGFLRDMFVHHAQAVDMAMTIRDRTEDQNLFFVATDIALTQSTQMGTMQGYLDLWGLALTGTEAPMAWMDMPMDGLMPGMATTEQIQQLTTLPVDQAEILFLQLMIRHHQGGVLMAEGALAEAHEPHVRDMAERIVVLQNGEIDAMNQMLIARGFDPITDPLPGHNH